MSEDAEIPKEKKKKKGRPGKAQWNNSYKNRLARRKAEREALPQQMSEVAVENKCLVAGEHQAGTPVVLESDMETISLPPKTLINDTLVDDVVSGMWQLIADEQHNKNDQYPRYESKGCMNNPIVILEPTNKEIVVESELNAVPTVKRTSGKAQWNNSYKNCLARNKKEREALAQSEAAGNCKFCHPQSHDVATQLEDVNPPLIPVAGTSDLSNISMTPGNDIAVAKILDLKDLTTHEKQHEVDSKLVTFVPLTTLGDAPTDWEVWDSCSCFDNPSRRLNSNCKMHTRTQPWM
ncbi:hypothetical protein GHT06_014523 [Daphnia sinensis]|uniref:Uncharacterized protein n=1 Tax=Daphnia sinensis TaxID=1820382 RepID=A0AAD5PWE5_9CRUS|nr:hypothetical protein GHT06_014523 [Daphnia sinensis]